jgi:cation diffusion facilitator family transporter
MNDNGSLAQFGHEHVFLGDGHEQSESRTWKVIFLCGAMMILEITGGLWFGSIALVADGMHMSTHAGALLLAALAYKYARKHTSDPRFSFGTGKFGDLAGFTSAIVLAMISLLIGYEAVSRLFAPVPIHFAEAIPIAGLGLIVNIASAWLLSGGHHHGHDHGHDHGHAHHHGGTHDDETKRIETAGGVLSLEVFEDGVPARFRMLAISTAAPFAEVTHIETVRPDGARQTFLVADKGGYLESIDEVPEPHEFTASVHVGTAQYTVAFEEHEHAAASTGRDNNMRAALVHVVADAAVSVLVIIGLILAKLLGWMWMDPLAGIIGALVIANWAFGLIRDTGGILLDMNPDRGMAEKLRQAIESDGDQLADLHLWRLGPGHLGAIIAVATRQARDPAFYKNRLARFKSLSHVTIEVQQSA